LSRRQTDVSVLTANSTYICYVHHPLTHLILVLYQ